MSDQVAAPAAAPSPLGSMPVDPAPANPTGTNEVPPPPKPAGPVIPENWKEALPEEFRNESSLGTIKTIEDLTKSYIHAQKMVGKDKVVVPDPKFATDADWKTFYQKVGQPKELADYKVEAPKGQESLDEGFLNDFKETAFKMNILPQQANQLLKWYSEKETALVEEAQNHQRTQIQQQLDSYRKEVGAAFDKKVLFANRTLEKFGGTDVQKFMQQNPAVGSNPLMIEFLSKVGEQLYSEDTFQGSEKVRGAMSPAEAQSEINTIMGDPNHPYFNGQHPKHQEAVNHMNKLWHFTTG